MKSELSTKLLDWYSVHRRDLPWRRLSDPYSAWVAEIMLQQTRVDTVIPYYLKWLNLFPSIPALAAATQQDVLNAWEGLGYYSRARNMHAAARIMVEKHNGQIPSNRSDLEKLPGIGKFSAADLLSIAYGQDLAAVDGNVRRVIARLFNIDLVSGSPEFEKRIQTIVDENLPPGQAGDYNQAWMDLGAMICLPDNPVCPNCPLRSDCQAFALGCQSLRPVQKTKPAVPTYIVTAGIISRNWEGRQQVFIARRPESGLLGGMWEYPGGKQEAGESLPECLQRELQEEIGIQALVGQELGVFRHAYTHFKVILHAYYCQIASGDPQPIQSTEITWCDLNHLSDYPMGKLDRMISDAISKKN
jgi:A/G-specific adenine glycosylase